MCIKSTYYYIQRSTHKFQDLDFHIFHVNLSCKMGPKFRNFTQLEIKDIHSLYFSSKVFSLN